MRVEISREGTGAPGDSASRCSALTGRKLHARVHGAEAAGRRRGRQATGEPHLISLSPSRRTRSGSRDR